MIKDHFRKAAFSNWEYGREMVAQIKRERPDLEAEEFKIAVDGQMSNIFLAGDEVFKTPLLPGPVATQRLMNEAKLQHFLYNNGLPVSRVTCVGEGAAFFGMQALPGAHLDDIWHALTVYERNQIARDVTDVKISVQKLTDAFKASGAHPVNDIDASFIKEMPKIIAMPKYSAVMRDFNRVTIEAEIAMHQILHQKPVLMHSDIDFKNILIDERTRRLSAVIDFGQACYSVRPETEIESFRSINPAFQQAAKQHYLANQRLVTPDTYIGRQFLNDVWLDYKGIGKPGDSKQFWQSLRQNAQTAQVRYEQKAFMPK